ncbi:MAG: hypothetical protein KBG92_12020 [Spirochaetes bacterium]|nr:hypothetical protein [Spirochaetota bacterium]HQQ51687.1 hypothetical protein [Spirochaetota bacterium]
MPTSTLPVYVMGSFFTIASRSAGPIFAAHPDPRTDSVRRNFFFGLMLQLSIVLSFII